MTAPLDPITITVIGVILVMFVPIIGLLFGLIALWLAGGLWGDGE